MSRENWKALPAAEWKRRLNQVREIAVQRLAAEGLGVDSDEDVGSMIAYDWAKDAVGSLLNPVLAVERERVDRIVEGIPDADGVVISFVVDVAATAFLFGMITGCHLTWPVIEAWPAPEAPPRTKAGAR